MFKISDKVVCVDDSGQHKCKARVQGDVVARGVIYVVRGAVDDDFGVPCIYLTGVFGGLWHDGREVPFKARRFRLLSEVQEENRLKATAEATT